MTVSEFLTPHLRELSSELEMTLPRLSSREDTEAVHDLRVVIRRLRSLLRPARRVYGKFHTDAVRAALKGVADRTGQLRDEEVLEETLSALTLPEPTAGEVASWVAKRKTRLRTLRASLLAVVRTGAVKAAMTMLEALLVLPVAPRSDKRADAFARKVVLAAREEVDEKKATSLDDVHGLHALRILYKRLRYAVDGFESLLPPELAALGPVATKFQKRLGDIHDIDVAKDTVARARGLDPVTREAIKIALDARRARVIAKYVAELTAPAAPPANVEHRRAHTPRNARPRVPSRRNRTSVRG